MAVISNTLCCICAVRVDELMELDRVRHCVATSALDAYPCAHQILDY